MWQTLSATPAALLTIASLLGARNAVVGRLDWAAFLLAQMIFGLAWSGDFAAVEWGVGRIVLSARGA